MHMPFNLLLAAVVAFGGTAWVYYGGLASGTPENRARLWKLQRQNFLYLSELKEWRPINGRTILGTPIYRPAATSSERLLNETYWRKIWPFIAFGAYFVSALVFSSLIDFWFFDADEFGGTGKWVQNSAQLVAFILLFGPFVAMPAAVTLVEWGYQTRGWGMFIEPRGGEIEAPADDPRAAVEGQNVLGDARLPALHEIHSALQRGDSVTAPRFED